MRWAILEYIGLANRISSLSLSCPERARLLHCALIFCKLIPTIRPLRLLNGIIR
ncbi:hypothetical protein [Rubritalea tangerina]|uniref:hypothetical protein n=1 Tax=Rubritalea tangerina TaxID=430798 RepID=UPI00362106F3